ncbi:MAG: hypothetical protein FWG94_06955 [Oscillospiraceae bacterium]|nr:hypothetical protein [Oscillospiraceae bacterium]
MTENKRLPQEITDVVLNITKAFKPDKIYLFSNKLGSKGKTAGFKLCVIIECEDRDEIQREIYRSIDCEVPYDIVLYTPEEWSELTKRKGSFAQKVFETGALVHE